MRFLVLFTLSLFLGGCSIITTFQKSKFITVNQLITTHKYNEAKGIIDDLVSGERSSKWPETWYYKGFLSRAAHQEGARRNDRSLQELYPDQLFVAYESFEKARKLSKGRRFDRKIRPQLARLVNDLQRVGTASFNQRNFSSAQRNFELALKLNESKLLSVPLDTNLLHNAAISAFESRNLDSAITHLTRLDNMRHSVNVSHLLFSSFLSKGDSLEARRVLERNIGIFPDSERLVLLLADFHLARNNPAIAIQTIDSAIARQDSASFNLLNAKGLVYKNSSQYERATELFEELTVRFPDQVSPFASIATCFYNMGVGIDERARYITNINQFQAEREKSISNYRRALQWIEKALVKNPGDTENQVFAERLRRLVGGRNESNQ